MQLMEPGRPIDITFYRQRQIKGNEKTVLTWLGEAIELGRVYPGVTPLVPPPKLGHLVSATYRRRGTVLEKCEVFAEWTSTRGTSLVALSTRLLSLTG